MTRTTLTEATTLAATPEPSGRMAVQIINPGWGSSGYYSADVLESAATDRIFPAGTRMFLDHPSESERFDRPERSVKDLAAVLTEDARWTGDALVAPVQVFGPYRDVIAEMKDAIGVSIRAAAEVTEGGEAEGRKGRVIDKLVEGVSVDFVTQAGRGGRILAVLESARTAMTVLADERHLADDAQAPVLIAAATESVPVNPAGRPTPTHGVQEDTMQQIEEAEIGRLREAAGRVPALESERDTAQAERDTALRQLAEARARTTATQRARTRVVEANATLAPATVDRIVADATRTVPLTDTGQLDEAALDQATDTARTVEEAYVATLAEAAGSGRVRGLGGSTTVHEADIDVDAAIASAFGRTATKEV